MIGICLGDRNSVGVGRCSSPNGDIAPRRDNGVKSTAVDNEIPYDWKGACSKWFDPDGISIRKVPHVQLTGRGPILSSMRYAIDSKRAHPADAFPTIMVKMNWVPTIVDDPLVHDVEHLEKGRLDRNIFSRILLDAAF